MHTMCTAAGVQPHFLSCSRDMLQRKGENESNWQAMKNTRKFHHGKEMLAEMKFANNDITVNLKFYHINKGTGQK